MAKSGVRPLRERGGGDAGREKGTPKHVQRPEAHRPGGASPAPVKATVASVKPAAAPVPAPPPTARSSDAVRAELWGDLSRLQERLTAAETAAKVARSEALGLGAERDALSVEIRSLRGERIAASDRLAAMDDERQRLLGRVAALEEALANRKAAHERTQESLNALRESLGPPSTSFAALLEARGVRGADETASLLRALGDQRLGADLAGMLVAPEPGAVEAFLEDRVALSCGHPGCAPSPGRAVLLVPPVRCDVCGGSDVKRAVRVFEDAALLNGLLRIAIVGGSPQYHRQIRTLINDPRIRITLIPGDRRRTASQAAADEAGSDAVIIWGATLLDHSLSQLYGRSGGRIVRIPHRGIARMLELAAAALNR